ncbi:MAG: Rieske (2Fe-2S) protein [Deltaproteobacteria bacterium]|nr:Rieske (2Fe-2S) protein [Deltaproteobacteria bacterium]
MGADDNALKRREFAGLLAAGALGAMAGGVIVCSSPQSSASVPIMLGPLSMFADKTPRMFPELGVAVVRVEGGLAFLRTRCTHLGCALRVVGEEFACPCHGGRFSLEGRVKAGPPRADLEWVEGGVDARGQVWCDPSRTSSDRRPIDA